jgi:hypothetical protein
VYSTFFCGDHSHFPGLKCGNATLLISRQTDGNMRSGASEQGMVAADRRYNAHFSKEINMVARGRLDQPVLPASRCLGSILLPRRLV